MRPREHAAPSARCSDGTLHHEHATPRATCPHLRHFHFHVNASPPTAHQPHHHARVTPFKPPQTESAPIAGPPTTSLPTTKIRPTSPFLFMTPTASPPTVLVSPRPNQAAPPTASRSMASLPAAFHSIAFAPNARHLTASLNCATLMPPRPRQHERVTSSASPRPCNHRPRNVCRVICDRLQTHRVISDRVTTDRGPRTASPRTSIPRQCDQFARHNARITNDTGQPSAPPLVASPRCVITLHPCIVDRIT